MSYYDDASLVLIPSGVKTSKVYSQKPTDGSGDFTFSRASTATRTNASGVIESVASNVPRLDYSGGATCPSLLLEGQRTNLVFPSDTATTQTRTVTATAHTLTFYGTGSVTLSGVATGTLTGTGANDRVALTFTPTAGSLILTVTGTVTNWQLEAGSFSSTLIPTTTATVTRIADAANKTGISSLIGQTEGTIFLDFIFKTPVLNTSGQIGISDPTSPYDRLIIWNNLTFNTLAANLQVNGSNIFNTSLGTFVNGQSYKIALAYKSGSSAAYVNGTQVFTNSSTFTFSSTITNFILGAYEVVGMPAHQLTNQALLFKTRLTNAQLAQMTTL